MVVRFIAAAMVSLLQGGQSASSHSVYTHHSFPAADSQLLRGQCHMCPLETPTSLCFHKARISSAALCTFDARAPAGMMQRFSTGHRSIYPRLQLVRQHFMVTSHAGTPVALWDRR